MTYIASVITVWIVIAVMFGFAIGWLARGRKKTSGRRSRAKKVKFR